MSRRTKRPTGFYDAVEYIGPRPQKPRKKHHFFGGWVILLIAVGAAWIFGKQLLPTVRAAENGASMENLDRTIVRLKEAGDFGSHLAAAALAEARSPAVHDESYYKISYPNGDVPAGRGNAEDVIIRAYREQGIDLQQLVHEDMEKNFRDYDQVTKIQGTDTNIDHRRAPNLKRFFERNGQTLSTSRNAADYLPGDIVFLILPGSHSGGDAHSQIKLHMAVIVPGPADHASEPAIVHNLETCTKWDDVLFSYQIMGHFRYGQ